MVYPGKDGSAAARLRLKVMREAFQDKHALDTLEQLAGRETVVALIQKHLEKICFPTILLNQKN